jgi:hypothetical protein
LVQYRMDFASIHSKGNICLLQCSGLFQCIGFFSNSNVCSLQYLGICRALSAWAS